MTDLVHVLPDFPVNQYVRILPCIELHRITTVDLITLDCLEIAKRTRLPVLDVKKLRDAILAALKSTLRLTGVQEPCSHSTPLRKTGKQVVDSWKTISLLDDNIDRALAGGIPTGSITEITGESGAGKTQFLLILLLSAQLPVPQGLSCATLYISTESPLPVTRVRQMLLSNPAFTSAANKPSLDRIISIVTSDLESQDHIIYFQVPVAIKRYGIRLLIIDSVASNYRAEFDRDPKYGANMAQRSADLLKLGRFLQNLARDMDVAVVVSNQVSDRITERFYGTNIPEIEPRPVDLISALPSDKTPLLRSSEVSNSQVDKTEPKMTSRDTQGIMSLDHQQRWFTGWGDEPPSKIRTVTNVKTPSLGLIWTNQIACRIALLKSPVFGPGLQFDDGNEEGEPILKKWDRWLKVVFASHAPESGIGITSAVKFEIKEYGLKADSNG
ncbi:DNA repair protein RAD57 [Blumeria hordei DH14]|uniref:DNA repair protein RAD57 n=1 Tax=Blumeria graminis f. sp. hordei (strain DH14) TaxID=546991 RepID=N1JGM6_BLUG1|nr:DNA repair protein RAD57 [Blumeria hordei DH14]